MLGYIQLAYVILDSLPHVAVTKLFFIKPGEFLKIDFQRTAHVWGMKFFNSQLTAEVTFQMKIYMKDSPTQ